MRSTGSFPFEKMTHSHPRSDSRRLFSPELLRLVLEKLQADYDAMQQAQLEAGDSPVPASEQTIDVKPTGSE